MKPSSAKVYYSQCWEDPYTLKNALQPEPHDSILSITSGGDNSLYLALYSPRKIVALDSNPVQNYLLELKIAAIQQLAYESYLKFLGVLPSNERLELFELLADRLSEEARSWWRSHSTLLQKGIVHIGKLEHYFAVFRNYILPLVHSRKTRTEFSLLEDIPEQERFYYEVWNTRKWRFLFHAFFNKHLLRWFGRHPELLSYVNEQPVSERYLKRVERVLSSGPVSQNYFLQYILWGGYEYEGVKPPYLTRDHFLTLKNEVHRITIVQSYLHTYLHQCPSDTFTKANLSDIFEGCSVSDTNELFSELSRVIAPQGRLAYWTNLVERTPAPHHTHLHHDVELETKLRREDRVFFYEGIHCYQVRP